MEPPCITLDDTQDIISPESVPATLALPVTLRKDQRSHAEMIAAAVQDRVEKNISVQKVAEKYNVVPRTIQAWVKKSGKIIPRKHAAKPPRSKPNKSTHFSPSESSNRILNLPPPEACDNAMDMIDCFLQRNSAQREEEGNNKLDRFASLLHQGEKQKFREGVKRKYEPGNRAQRKKMWFMESGEEYFRCKAFEKKKRPAWCVWSACCCLCGKDEVHPTRLNIKRKSFYLRDDLHSNAPSNKLGRMSTWVFNSKKVTAHYSCLYFAAGKGMVQSVEKNVDTQLERFPIAEVLRVLEKKKKSRCAFCGDLGAASQCANGRCNNDRPKLVVARGAGWYHLPCGLKNGTLQAGDGKTWCGRCGKGPDNNKGLYRIGKGGCKLRKGRKQERGRVQSQPTTSTNRSQFLQELQSHFSQDSTSIFSNFTVLGDQQGITEATEVRMDLHLEPISAQEISSEVSAEKDTDGPRPGSSKYSPEHAVPDDNSGEEDNSAEHEREETDLFSPFPSAIESSEKLSNQGIEVTTTSVYITAMENYSSQTREATSSQNMHEIDEGLLKETQAALKQHKIKADEDTKFFQGELKRQDSLMTLELKKKEAEMKKKDMEMKKREEEWKARMKKIEEELQDKDNQILELHSELEKEKAEKKKEKEEKNEAKKELDTIKQMNICIGDLLSRMKPRPTAEESKGEYIEKEDVELKRENEPNAGEDDSNYESPRYSQWQL